MMKPLDGCGGAPSYWAHPILHFKFGPRLKIDFVSDLFLAAQSITEKKAMDGLARCAAAAATPPPAVTESVELLTRQQVQPFFRGYFPLFSR